MSQPGQKTAPLHATIIAMVGSLNHVLSADAAKARVIAQLMNTTTIPPAHLGDVKQAFTAKIAKLSGNTYAYAELIKQELEVGLQGVQSQIDLPTEGHAKPSAAVRTAFGRANGVGTTI